MIEVDVAAAAGLDRAAKTAKNNPRNHLAVLQLVNELEQHVSPAHDLYAASAPLFGRVRAGTPLTLMEIEGLVKAARREAKLLRGEPN